MGNCYNRFAPEDLQTAESMARVVRMRKQVLGKQHAEVLLRAKANRSKGTRSLRADVAQLKQMQQQMQKLDEVETNFVNIAGINQTANTLQAFAGAYASGTRADVATVDEVLDLQDAIQEQQHAFQEIDTVLAQTWMPVDDRPPPPSGPGTSQERALEQELQGYIDEADPSPKLHQLDPQQETPALEMPSPPDSLISTPTTPTSRQETESSQPPVLSFV